ncbi:hypothetical protein [Flavobacterium sp. H4147]|uniref:hypothetical protein n=1 Tax=Flavobacterium sp. H4147 TaxID=3034149 RepID=UPI0023EAAAA3|nr:hypothetical protein [Flavobacterium sp. H4147]
MKKIAEITLEFFVGFAVLVSSFVEMNLLIIKKHCPRFQPWDTKIVDNDCVPMVETIGYVFN